MQRCLETPELIRAICDESERSTALAFAKTCSAILNFGLDRVWRHIDCFEPLIACLPNSKENPLFRTELKRMGFLASRGCPGIGVKTVLNLRRAITPVDLQRYLAEYAHRIRIFTPCLDGEKRCLSTEVFQSLQIVTNYKLGHLSPGLRTLHWVSQQSYSQTGERDPASQISAYISLFLAGTITSFAPVDSPFCPITWTSSFFALYNLPRLKELDLSGISTGERDRGPNSCIIAYTPSTHWQALEVLTLGSFSSDCIDRLPPLPQLRTLKIVDRANNPAPRVKESPIERIHTQFPKLETVTINSLFIGGFLSVVRDYFGPPNITVIKTMEICASVERYPEFDCHQECQEVITAIGGISTLESVRLVTSDPTPVFHEEIDAVDAISQVDVSPLYAIENLKELVIHCALGVRIMPEDISKFLAAWPSIQILDLCTNYASQESRFPYINHTHVLELLDACPSLRVLGLRFDTTQITEEYLRGTIPRYLNLRKFRVGESPIASPNIVLAFVNACFPLLEDLDTHFVPFNGREQSFLRRRWDQVVQGWKAGEYA